MTDTPEMKLAKALRLAADEYCRETNRPFEARFEFGESTTFGENPRTHVLVVTVSPTEETRA